MNEHSYKIKALILGRRNQGEGDRVLNLLTQKRGRILLLAKSVRKPASHRRSQLELFNLIKAQVFNGKTWDILGEVESINSFLVLKSDLRRLRAAYEICEISHKFLPEGEANENIFNLVKESLEKLNHADPLNIAALLFSFKVELLKNAGFWQKRPFLSPTDIDRYIETIIQSKIKSQKIKV